MAEDLEYATGLDAAKAAELRAAANKLLGYPRAPDHVGANVRAAPESLITTDFAREHEHPTEKGVFAFPLPSELRAKISDAGEMSKLDFGESKALVDADAARQKLAADWMPVVANTIEVKK